VERPRYDDSRWRTNDDRVAAYIRKRGELDADAKPDQAALIRARAELRAQQYFRDLNARQRFDLLSIVRKKVTPRLPT
jgi:hypothetical protein